MKVVLMLAALSIAAPLAAQPPSSSQPADDHLQLRYQISVMEGVLERAVQHAAQVLNRNMQAISPDMVLLTGTPRVRGFRLDGYGIFFDVDVPVLRQSVSWSFRVLNQNRMGADEALATMRRVVAAMNDKQARAEMERALRLLELRYGPAPGQSPGTGPTSVRSAAVLGPDPGAPPQPPAQATASPDWMANPDDAYADEVKRALIDAMLDYSGPMNLGPSEKLVIGARDNADLGGGGGAADGMTMVITIKSADLEAFRTQKIMREDIHRRVEVRVF